MAIGRHSRILRDATSAALVFDDDIVGVARVKSAWMLIALLAALGVEVNSGGVL
jgi:hypothetical protein